KTGRTTKAGRAKLTTTISGYGSRPPPGRQRLSLPRTCKLADISLLRFADRRRRAREARGGGGLGHAVTLDENLARRHVRMFRRLRHGEDRREADVGAFHDLAPVRARFALEHLGQLLLQRGPGLAVHLRVEVGVGEISMLAQQRIELRLDRTDRDEV